MDQMAGVSTAEAALFARAAAGRIPINGSLELTPLCNMNCDMCYVRLDREHMEAQGRLRTADEWLEIARQMKDAGVLFLLLTGGEPLTYPDFRKLYLALRKMGMILTVNTNGTLLNEEWAEFFGKYKPRRINITLYGANDSTYQRLCHYPGGFERTISAVKALRRHGVDVRLGASMTKENAAELPAFFEIAKELDVPLNVDTYMLPATRERERAFREETRLTPKEAAALRVEDMRKQAGPEDFEAIRSRILAEVDRARANPVPAEPKPMGCLAGKCSFTINWQGEIRPCVILSAPSVSVFEHGFLKAWQIMSEKIGRVLLNGKCTACPLRSLCHTCAASALLEAGAADRIPEYMCQYTHETERLLREEGNHNR
jgi:radical SAM protein with 4Fe4S-binding SPASM domain